MTKSVPKANIPGRVVWTKLLAQSYAFPARHLDKEFAYSNEYPAE